MGLFKRNKVWWMGFAYHGKWVRKSTEATDRRLAEAILGKVRTSILEGKYFEKLQEQERTVKEMLDRYFDEHGHTLRTAHALQLTAKRVCAVLGADRVLAEITSDEIARYKTTRAADGVGPSSINRELALLSAAFNRARRHWKWCRENPVSDAGLCPGEVVRDRWLTPEEEARLLPACPPWVQEVVGFFLHTGLRFGELAALTWADIDLQRKLLIVQQSKNKTKRTVPLNHAAMAILRSRIRSTKTNVVFYTKRHAPLRESPVWHVFKAASTRAKVENIRLHDLRHTFATRLVQSGQDLYGVQRLLGHKTAAMTQRYAHHSSESLRAVVEALDSTNLAQSGGVVQEAVG